MCTEKYFTGQILNILLSFNFLEKMVHLFPLRNQYSLLKGWRVSQNLLRLHLEYKSHFFTLMKTKNGYSDFWSSCYGFNLWFRL